jgi:hypothetical protein
MSAFGPHVEKALKRDPDLPTKSFVYFIQADDSRMSSSDARRTSHSGFKASNAATTRTFPR